MNYSKYVYNQYKQDIQKIKKSKATKENFIRISCICCHPEMFYNFILKTEKQKGSFYICTALGDINYIWEFLEDIVKGKKISYFVSEQEGPTAILIAQDIGDNKIRLTLMNNEYFEESWNNNKIQLKIKRYLCRKRCIDMDIILNKKDLIYTFYINLLTIFSNPNNYEWLNSIKHNVCSDEEAQRDSEIIKKYLGYTKATSKDKKLLSVLYTGNLEKIEKLLKNKVNPNAIYNNGYDKLPIIEEFMENAFDKNISKIQIYKILKLLIKYGAKTQSIYSAVYCLKSIKIVKLLLKNNCVFDDTTIEDISTDYISYQSENNKTTEFYKKLESLYDNMLYRKSYCDYKSLDEIMIKWG